MNVHRRNNQTIDARSRKHGSGECLGPSMTTGLASDHKRKSQVEQKIWVLPAMGVTLLLVVPERKLRAVLPGPTCRRSIEAGPPPLVSLGGRSSAGGSWRPPAPFSRTLQS